jgi:hypothetical protein
MSIWTLTLVAVVTLIWMGMFGAVAYLAAQRAHKVVTGTTASTSRTYTE